MGTPGADETARSPPWVTPSLPSMAGLEVHLLWQRRQNHKAAAKALVVAHRGARGYSYVLEFYATLSLGSELA